MSTESTLANLTPDATIGKIIAADRTVCGRLASIGMEPVRHKDETLRSVCRKLNWSEKEVWRWVSQNGMENQPDQPDFGDNLARWANYLVDEFHPRLFRLLDGILTDLHRIRRVHGKNGRPLKQIERKLTSFEDKLRYYTRFQSKILFPAFSHLTGHRSEIRDGIIQNITRGVRIMEEDRELLEKMMNAVERKAKQFENLPGAGPYLGMLHSNLQQLFTTLRKKLHIEREILLPLINEKTIPI